LFIHIDIYIMFHFVKASLKYLPRGKPSLQYIPQRIIKANYLRSFQQRRYSTENSKQTYPSISEYQIEAKMYFGLCYDYKYMSLSITNVKMINASCQNNIITNGESICTITDIMGVFDYQLKQINKYMEESKMFEYKYHIGELIYKETKNVLLNSGFEIYRFIQDNNCCKFILGRSDSYYMFCVVLDFINPNADQN